MGAGTAHILGGTQASDHTVTKIPTILRSNTQSEATKSILQFIKQEVKRNTAEIEAIHKKTAQARREMELLDQRKRNIIAGMRKAAEELYTLARFNSDCGASKPVPHTKKRETFEQLSRKADDHVDRLLAMMSPAQLRSLGLGKDINGSSG